MYRVYGTVPPLKNTYVQAAEHVGFVSNAHGNELNVLV